MATWDDLDRCVRAVAFDINRSKLNRTTDVDRRMDECREIAVGMMRNRIVHESMGRGPLAEAALRRVYPLLAQPESA